jgi:hypothetical protein
MTQLLVAHVKLKMILKLIQKFNPCVNNYYQVFRFAAVEALQYEKFDKNHVFYNIQQGSRTDI